MRKGGGRVTDEEKRYQILRGRLYERLPVLALALGLLDWRKAEKTGTDGQLFYAYCRYLDNMIEKFNAATGSQLVNDYGENGKKQG